MSLYVDIQKKLCNFVLNVKFEINKDFLGILGTSGCGKSMTLKCIAGIEKPDSGKIVLNGRTLFDSEQKIDLPPQQRKVGYLFQSYALFPNMTVEENIQMAVNGTNEEKKTIALEKITALHLNGLENKRPRLLSGGQQQRVAMARLLASDPDIILLDEPFSALDSHLKHKLEEMLTEVSENYRGSVVMVSHDRDEIYRLCGKIAIFAQGRIDALAEKFDLFDNPKTLNAAILTGCKNFSRARPISKTQVEAIDWGIVLQSERPIPADIDHVGIRAHFIEINPPDHRFVNMLDCNLIKEYEDPFSAILVFKNKKLLRSNDYTFIRCQTDKTYAHVFKLSDNVTIALPEEKLLFLKGSNMI